MASPVYKRILLKLSGEALMGNDQYGINRAAIERMVTDVAEVSRMGVEVAIVIGGRQYFSWRRSRCTGDGSRYR